MSLFKKGSRALLSGFAKILPGHAKRIVLWSTLYGKMCEQRKVPIENTIKLNQVLHLAKSDEATMLPIKMGGVIWPDLDKCANAIRDAVQGKSIEECAKQFVAGLPRFLKYASERYIVEDFRNLVSAHRTQVPVAA